MIYRPFLSHQWNDKQVVRRIAEALAEIGMDPILDVWEFVPGDSLTDSMNDGISKATAFILFWSKHSAVSQNVKYEREIGLAEMKKRDDFRVICVRLDDTPTPKEHSFRLYIDWTTGHRRGKGFDNNSQILQRAIRGMPAEQKPIFSEDWRVPVADSTDAVRQVVAEARKGNHQVIAYRSHPHALNPITDRPLRTDTFFDQVKTAAEDTGLIVLDYDESSMTCPFTYIPSYNLVAKAIEHPAFASCRAMLKKAYDSYDAKYDSQEDREHNPWRTEPAGGARFLASVALSLGKNVVALLRWVDWIPDPKDGLERSYVYADELPALKMGMSVVVHVWKGADIAPHGWLVDYEVDDSPGKRCMTRIGETGTVA